VSEVVVEFTAFTSDPFQYQELGAEARRMRLIGMSVRGIGRATWSRRENREEEPCLLPSGEEPSIVVGAVGRVGVRQAKRG